MNAKLSMVGGPASGQTIQIPRGKLLIGRAEDCDVRPESEFVSGTSKTTGPIELKFEGSHAHLARIHWSTHGVVR